MQGIWRYTAHTQFVPVPSRAAVVLTFKNAAFLLLNRTLSQFPYFQHCYLCLHCLLFSSLSRSFNLVCSLRLRVAVCTSFLSNHSHTISHLVQFAASSTSNHLFLHSFQLVSSMSALAVVPFNPITTAINDITV